MNVFIVACTFNDSHVLIDCAFKDLAAAQAYVAALNGNKAKAVARCKELIALRDSEEMVKFLDEEGGITFEVLDVKLK